MQDGQDYGVLAGVGVCLFNRRRGLSPRLPIADVGGLRLSVGCDRLIATCSGSGDPELQGLEKGLEDLNVYRTAAATRRKGPADLNNYPV